MGLAELSKHAANTALTQPASALTRTQSALQDASAARGYNSTRPWAGIRRKTGAGYGHLLPGCYCHSSRNATPCNVKFPACAPFHAKPFPRCVLGTTQTISGQFKSAQLCQICRPFQLSVCSSPRAGLVRPVGAESGQRRVTTAGPARLIPHTPGAQRTHGSRRLDEPRTK